MNSDELVLRESIERVKKICKAIRVVCIVCLICFTIGWIIFTWLLVFKYLAGGSEQVELSEIAYLVLFGLLTISLLIVALRIFSDIVAGESPFILKQVKRFNWVGILFLFYTALEALLSVSFSYSLFGEGDFYGIVGGSNVATSFIKVNALTFIAAIVCFGLAVIFKYGVLLQQISDDTL